MPVAATNETPVDEPVNETPAVVTSAMPVEQANEAPAVATSAVPVEQSNDTGVASNNEMSITMPPHLLGVVPSTTNFNTSKAGMVLDLEVVSLTLKLQVVSLTLKLWLKSGVKSGGG